MSDKDWADEAARHIWDLVTHLKDLREGQPESIAELIRLHSPEAKLRAEIRILRGLVQTNPEWKCPQGIVHTDGKPLKSMGECPLGFPGCECADDRIAVLCEDEERLVSKLRAEIERLKEHLADYEANDDRTYMMDRCQDCGHRLWFMASACPQCGAPASRYEPESYPDTCECDRCVEAREALATTEPSDG